MKLERIEQDIGKVQEKISQYQKQLHFLEEKKKEAENLQVLGLLQSYRLSHKELMVFLKKQKPNVTNSDKPIKEEITHEEA